MLSLLTIVALEGLWPNVDASASRLKSVETAPHDKRV